VAAECPGVEDNSVPVRLAVLWEPGCKVSPWSSVVVVTM
jgi:hypothetical protein